LPAIGVTHRRVVLSPPQRALPLLRRSYGLMRPTPILSLLSVFALYRASLQVAASPCWTRVVPDVISASLSLDACAPLPVVSAVHMPVTSRASSAFPEVQGRVGSPPYSVQRLPHGGVFREGSRRFLVVQASRFACHPGRSHRWSPRGLQGSRGVYVRAEPMSLPAWASHMLAVRIGQLTVGDLHPIRLAALSAAPGPATPGDAAGRQWLPRSVARR
jgi:hypothetical protein